MGWYIPGPVTGKAAYLVAEHGGRVVNLEEAANLVDTFAVIACLENPTFDAALFCYDQREFEVASHNDGRDKTFVVIDRDLAIQLSGYKKIGENHD